MTMKFYEALDVQDSFNACLRALILVRYGSLRDFERKFNLGKNTVSALLNHSDRSVSLFSVLRFLRLLDLIDNDVTIPSVVAKIREAFDERPRSEMLKALDCIQDESFFIKEITPSSRVKFTDVIILCDVLGWDLFAGFKTDEVWGGSTRTFVENVKSAFQVKFHKCYRLFYYNAYGYNIGSLNGLVGENTRVTVNVVYYWLEQLELNPRQWLEKESGSSQLSNLSLFMKFNDFKAILAEEGIDLNDIFSSWETWFTIAEVESEVINLCL